MPHFGELIAQELSEARATPSAYAASLERNLDGIDGYEARLVTEFLRDQDPIKRLSLSTALCDAAVARAEELAGTPVRHEPSPPDVLAGRLAAYGEWTRWRLAEVIVYKDPPLPTPRQFVVEWLAAASAEARRTRTSALNPEFRTVGAAYVPGPGDRAVFVLIFAADFTDFSARKRNRLSRAMGSPGVSSPASPGASVDALGSRLGGLGLSTTSDERARYGECPICREALIGDVVIARGRSMHKTCFTCARCSTPFRDGRYVEREGKPYCTTCSERLDELALPLCSACSLPIRGTVLRAMGGQYHDGASCFVCSGCLAPFRGTSYNNVDGRPFCDRCVSPRASPRTSDPTCAGCHMRIRGTVLRAMGETWHPRCFMCSTCRAPLADQALGSSLSFSTVNGRPTCDQCVRSRV